MESSTKMQLAAENSFNLFKRTEEALAAAASVDASVATTDLDQANPAADLDQSKPVPMPSVVEKTANLTTGDVKLPPIVLSSTTSAPHAASRPTSSIAPNGPGPVGPSGPIVDPNGRIRGALSLNTVATFKLIDEMSTMPLAWRCWLWGMQFMAIFWFWSLFEPTNVPFQDRDVGYAQAFVGAVVGLFVRIVLWVMWFAYAIVLSAQVVLSISILNDMHALVAILQSLPHALSRSTTI